jgi:hypothetical protein
MTITNTEGRQGLILVFMFLAVRGVCAAPDVHKSRNGAQDDGAV